jgi:hypothetical protein
MSRMLCCGEIFDFVRFALTSLTSQTSIIATIGPKTNNVEMLSQLRDAGMNIGEYPSFALGSFL